MKVVKVCSVSPRSKATSREILDFLTQQTAALVLLPGASDNTPSPKSVQRVLQSGVSVFVEGATGKMMRRPSLVTSHSIETMPKQVFAQNPTAIEMDSLAAALPDRTFTIGGRTVTFIICGEIIGFNVDGTTKHNRVLHRGEIIANPAHWNMGRWHVLDRRFKQLSRRGAAVHAANNVLATEKSKTDVRIYRRGKLAGLRRLTGNIAWCLEAV